MRPAALAVGVILVVVSSTARAHETFPMSGAVYREHFEVRLGRYRERLEQRMAEHHIDATKRADARKRMEFLEVLVRGAITRAVADGTVTEAEANQVRDLSKAGRERIYGDLGIERAKGE